MNIAKFFITAVIVEHLWWLLLKQKMLNGIVVTITHSIPCLMILAKLVYLGYIYFKHPTGSVLLGENNRGCPNKIEIFYVKLFQKCSTTKLTFKSTKPKVSITSISLLIHN